MADNCATCGRWTEEGKAKLAERHRLRPIYGTDLQRPMHEVIREIRERMTALRGSISDFQFAFPAWRERTQPVEGLLTCGISALYHTLQELEEFERESVKPNASLSGQPCCINQPPEK